MDEVIGKVENLIRVVLENVCSIGRQKTFTINVTSNSENFMSLGLFFILSFAFASRLALRFAYCKRCALRLLAALGRRERAVRASSCR